MRLSASLLSLLGCLALPGAASAQAPADRAQVALSWVRAAGAETCIPADTLRDHVRSRLGYDPFVDGSSGARRLEGVITRDDDTWRVELYQRNEAGQTLGSRNLSSEAEDCRALSEAATLAVALAVDPEAALAPPPSDDPASVEPSAAEPELTASERTAPEHTAPERTAPETTAPATGPAPAEPPPTDPPSERLRLSLGATASYDFNPGLGFGARLAVDGPIVDHLRWMSAATYWAETRTAGPDGDFGVSQTLFSVGMCAGFGEPWIQLDGCVSADLGANMAVVYAPTPVAPGERFALASTALARLDVRLFGPLWASVSAGVVVPLVRYQFRVRNRDVAFEPSYVSPFFAADLGVRL